MKSLYLIPILALAIAGCQQEAAPDNTPRTGTLNMDNLTPEEKAQKVMNDPNIPDQYKQTYLNSLKGQQGAPPPPPAAGTGQ